MKRLGASNYTATFTPKVLVLLVIAFLLAIAIAINVNFLSRDVNHIQMTAKTKHSREKEEEYAPAYWRGHVQSRLQSNLTHPHRGARHPNGTEGMIVNPLLSRLGSFDPLDIKSTFIMDNVTCPRDKLSNLVPGIEGKGGHKVLQRIRQGIHKSRQFIKAQEQAMKKLGDTSTAKSKSNPNDTESIIIQGNEIARARKSRILCMIYTVHYPTPENNFDNSNLRAQANTWARLCDGYFAASNYTDHRVGAIDLLHQGEEEYANMWQKVRSMWAYAYDHYREEYDFFYICGDDVYVGIDNLRAFVDGNEVIRLENGFVDRISSAKMEEGSKLRDPQKRPRPLIFGTPMMWRGCPFPSGGPGYTINRAALAVLVEQGIPTFLPDNKDSREDVFLGSFFCEVGVYISHSNDENDGERYWSSAEFSSKYDGKSVVGPKMLKQRFNITIPLGEESASMQQIGFHLKDDKKMLEEQGHTIAEQMYRYHAILNDWCSIK